MRRKGQAQLHPDALKCACCGVESSSEFSFVEHLYGAAHTKKAGRPGFAGLVPNAAGLIPKLWDPMLIAEAEAFERGLPIPSPSESSTSSSAVGGGTATGLDDDAEGMEEDAHLEVRYEGAPPLPGPWLPPLREVSVSEEATAEVREALAELADMQAAAEEEKAEAVARAQQQQQDEEQDGRRASRHPGGRRGRRGRQPRRMPPVPAPLVEGGPLAATRDALPVASYRGEILDALSHEICIVEGETGSGKTTQVAQYVLEAAAAEGQQVNIICTQPRRISAIGVADRVAAERGERLGEAGSAVGYAVRGESKQCQSTSLLFCTTGVLLRMLEEEEEEGQGGGGGGGGGGTALANVTHVLVDEVHERSVETDFLLLALKRLLLARRDRDSMMAAGGALPLHVCLMSATMDGDVLAAYFGDDFVVPRVSFPGRTFPVEQLHLEDAMQLTNHYVRPGSDWHIDSPAARKRAEMAAAAAAAAAASAAAAAAAATTVVDLEATTGEASSIVAPSVEADEAPYPLEPEPLTAEVMARRFPSLSPFACEAMASMDPDGLNVDLIAELVAWYLQGGGRDGSDADADPSSSSSSSSPSSLSSVGGGAVLVFLSGVKEIEDVKMALLGSDAIRSLGEEQAEWVLPLHGSLPPDEQRRVFEHPPQGVTKVVLATNVAETSITIDDVDFVIDSGRVKLLSYDASRRISSLDDVLVSRAASKQRRGRAGRVRPGVCVHLFASDAPLERYTEPEVRRVPLEQLIMRIKTLRLAGSAADVCAELPEPPAMESVATSVGTLKDLGALDADEQLTPLGELLATLPIDPRLGKLLLLGAGFGVLDEALTIAAGLASRSPFLSPFDARRDADESRKAFAEGTQSDFLAIKHAYDEFDGRDLSERFHFARFRFLGIKTLQGVANFKRQLLELLAQARVAPRGMKQSWVEVLGRKEGGGADGVRLALEVASEQRGEPPPVLADEVLITALVCASLYPQLGYLHAPKTKKGKPANSAQIRLHLRDGEQGEAPTEVLVHPASVNSANGGDRWYSPYVCMHDICQTTQLYARGTAALPPLAPLIFCGQRLELSDSADEAFRIATLDDWLRLKVPAEIAPLLVELRYQVENLVGELVERAGGRGGARQRHQRSAAERAAALEALTRATVALLHDAYVEPLPPPPKPPKIMAKKARGKKRTKGSRRRKAQLW